MVRLRAFRAKDDPQGCEKFLVGHKRVMEIYGIEMVTSMDASWVERDDVYLFTVEEVNSERVLGGGRIHVHGYGLELPIENALGELDSNIFNLLKEYHLHGGVGELCGLWNSREVAGLGFGAVYLSRAGMSLANQINIKNLFSLCASYTVPMGINLGFEVEERLGNKGKFYYPKLDLIATTLIHKDLYGLSKATNTERDAVFRLRDNPKQTSIEVYRQKKIEINYQLKLNI